MRGLRREMAATTAFGRQDQTNSMSALLVKIVMRSTPLINGKQWSLIAKSQGGDGFLGHCLAPYT